MNLISKFKLPLVFKFHSNICIKSFSQYSKTILLKLRKETGLPFGLCKEGLQKNDNEYVQTLKWLEKESVLRGISKAGKLSSRLMSQGLLGMLASKTSASIVEVNCETDFVARNTAFQQLLASSAISVAEYFKLAETERIYLTEEDLKSLTSLETGKALHETLTNTIGNVGEKIALRRALCLKALDPSFRIASYSHMSTSGVATSYKSVRFGKYAALLLYKPLNSTENSAWYNNADSVCTKVCQHIVGMKPNSSLKITERTKNPDNEKCLFHQPFLLDESITVGDLLSNNDIEVIDFIRIECGAEEEPDGQNENEKVNIKT